MNRSTPAALGYAMPAEWHPHAATWLAWPKDPLTWPDRVPQAEAVFLRMIEVLAEHETVNVLVDDEATRDLVRGRMPWPQARSVQFHAIPTVDSWIRDYGPNFLLARQERRSPGATLAHSPLAYNAWGFNAWGDKYEALKRDAGIPRALAPLLRVPVFEPGIVLEGGSIDVNGEGVVMTTEQCLLNPNRNPSLSRADIERALRDYLGVSEVLWLGEGVAGDDTDGHIDDKLPMPGAVEADGEPLPASYANFYIANGVVLLPVFDHPNDAVALDTLGRLFPDRRIVPIDCRDLVWGMGAIHCVTQQQPKA
jgi:agmatine deiminase